MCDTCTLLQLDRCPPFEPSPGATVADHIAFETDVAQALHRLTSPPMVLDATTELVLRARLVDGRPLAA